MSENWRYLIVDKDNELDGLPLQYLADEELREQEQLNNTYLDLSSLSKARFTTYKAELHLQVVSCRIGLTGFLCFLLQVQSAILLYQIRTRESDSCLVYS